MTRPVRAGVHKLTDWCKEDDQWWETMPGGSIAKKGCKSVRFTTDLAYAAYEGDWEKAETMVTNKLGIHSKFEVKVIGQLFCCEIYEAYTGKLGDDDFLNGTMTNEFGLFQIMGSDREFFNEMVQFYIEIKHTCHLSQDQMNRRCNRTSVYPIDRQFDSVDEEKTKLHLQMAWVIGRPIGGSRSERSINEFVNYDMVDTVNNIAKLPIWHFMVNKDSKDIIFC